VSYWVGAQAVCFHCQSARRIPVPFEAVGILHRLADWVPIDEIRDRVAPEGDPVAVMETIALLHTLGLVEREDDALSDESWLAWTPEAAFFHFSTKNGVFPEDLAQRDRELVEKAKHHPQPPPTKRVEGARLRLPSSDLSSEDLHTALIKRRTWRRFSDRPLAASALGTLLDYTFGVRARGSVAGQGPMIVRTSPSGGSRHPIEAYVLAWNVEGLAAGAYHYDSDAMELVDLQRPVSATEIPALLAHQTYFAGAGAAVIMCPVFARTMWRYGHSRAYRTVLIDAGHLGQTFCLVATALGLAPFTTMAFSESALEELLGLDGVSECPIYVAGVGVTDPAAGASPGRWDVKS
jgi:SagB-type dehydrogenase family enzyme